MDTCNSKTLRIYIRISTNIDCKNVINNQTKNGHVQVRQLSEDVLDNSS